MKKIALLLFLSIFLSLCSCGNSDGGSDNGSSGKFWDNLKTETTEQDKELTATPVFFNTNENDETTLASSVSKYKSFVHYGVKFENADVNKVINIKESVMFPDGDIVTDSFQIKNGKVDGDSELKTGFWDVGMTKNPHDMPNGNMTFTYFDNDTGTVVGSFTIKVTDDRTSKWNAELLYATEDENDPVLKDGGFNASYSNKVSIYSTFFQYVIEISGGANGETGKFKRYTYYPGKTTVHDDNVGNGKMLGGRSQGLQSVDGITTGNLWVVFVDTAANEIVGSCKFEITDEEPKVSITPKLEYFNADENDKTTLSSISKYNAYIHYGVKFEGVDSSRKYKIKETYIGLNGEKFDNSCEIVNGKINGNTLWERNWNYGLYFDPENVSAGQITLEYRDEDTGKLLGSFEINVTDKKTSKWSVSLLYASTDPNDPVFTNKNYNTFFSRNISKNCSFLRFEYEIKGGASGEKFNAKRYHCFPNKTSNSAFEAYSSTWWLKWDNGLKSVDGLTTGSFWTLIIDTDTNEIIGSWKVEITD